MHRGAQGLVLLYAQPHRLFKIDVLARLYCRQGHQHVPVVRRGSKNNVNVVALNQFTKVIVGCASVALVMLVHQVPGRLAHVAFDIADRHNMSIFFSKKVAHHGGAPRPNADTTNGDSITGGNTAGLTQRR